MRWSSLLALASSAIGALAAKKSADRFTQFHTKALASAPIKLADHSYKSLTSTPRDYSVAVLLTALETRFGCQLCREFQPEWELLAKSWTKGDKAGESRLVFGTLDFADGKDTFMSLNLQTAPVLLFFPPTTGEHAASSPDPVRYDFTSGPQDAEQVHRWLSRSLPDRPHPPVRRPINWVRWISSVTILLGGTTALAVAWPWVTPILQSRSVWAAVSLIAILLFTSGHMFNHIRKVPYVAADGRGGVAYFAAGFQSQYGLETQIVAAIYGVLSFAAISLAIKVPRISEPKSQQAAVLIWAIVLFVVYSFLMNVFKMKNGGYPFSLPPFF